MTQISIKSNVCQSRLDLEWFYIGLALDSLEFQPNYYCRLCYTIGVFKPISFS